MTSRQDYYKPGDYNAICDGCGAKLKATELTKDWKGFFKCVRCWEPRQPQDFVRARQGAEPAPVPFVRAPAQPSYVLFCTPNGRTAVPDLALPGCAIPGFIDPANTLEL